MRAKWTGIFNLTWCLMAMTLYIQEAESGCPTVSLSHGRARVRGRGSRVYYSCRGGYRLLGKNYAVCINNRWSQPTPVCIKANCRPFKTRPPIITSRQLGGALAVFSCPRYHVLQGDRTLICVDRQWNGTVPVCNYIGLGTLCTFETMDMCGWQSNPDGDVSWRQSTRSTPTAGTGPDSDHTYSDDPSLTGTYIYFESSHGQQGHRAILTSPIYKRTVHTSCISFWYHMYSRRQDGMGSLELYAERPGGALVTPISVLNGSYGNQWNRADAMVDPTLSTYQISLVAIRGSSIYGDIAVDDIRMKPCPLTTPTVLPSTTLKPVTTTVRRTSVTMKTTPKRLFTSSRTTAKATSSIVLTQPSTPLTTTPSTMGAKRTTRPVSFSNVTTLSQTNTSAVNRTFPTGFPGPALESSAVGILKSPIFLGSFSAILLIVTVMLITLYYNTRRRRPVCNRHIPIESDDSLDLTLRQYPNVQYQRIEHE